MSNDTLNSNIILERVKLAVASVIGTPVIEIDNNANFKNDLGLDSLDLIELEYKLEIFFKIELEIELLQQINTVQKVANFIEELQTKQI